MSRAGLPDENETGDPLARSAEGAANALRISAPAGYPATDIAERVSREQQVHARSSARQLLLPNRDLVVRDRRRDEHHELARVMSELVFLLVVGNRRARIVLASASRKSAPKASRWSSATVTKRHGKSLPWSGVRAAIVSMRSSSACVGPGPTSSRGLAERRVSRSERIDERSLSIDAGR